MITYEQWLEKCEATKRMAEEELRDTLRLRESLFVARERARNTLRAQTDVTNYTLRKRIYDTQRARNELEWQKMKVLIVIAIFDRKFRLFSPKHAMSVTFGKNEIKKQLPLLLNGSTRARCKYDITENRREAEV